MLPVFAIIGRPNVGKSTLFNYLTRSRAAIVADMPGVTRDRQYGEGNYRERRFIVIDTGGLEEIDDPEIATHTDLQTEQAMSEADYLLFMVDADMGLTNADRAVAKKLRNCVDKVILLVNKADRKQAELVCSEFHELGIGEPRAVAAKSGRGVDDLFAELLAGVKSKMAAELEDNRLAVAVIGRPNVGKSTLINRLLGEERVVVLDRPGTTRDSIYIPFTRRNQDYTLIDTAGVRRRAKMTETVEKFSFVKTMQAIIAARVVIILLDAQAGLVEQDLRLMNLVMSEGKAVVLAFNKWDGMSEEARQRFKDQIDQRLDFVSFARRYFISALHGSGVGKLYPAIIEAYQASSQTFSTSELTKTLQQVVQQHQPPMVRGRRIRLRLAHLGGHDPLVLVIHGKQTEALPADYRRYLVNFFRKRFNLIGVPILLQLKSDANPYD
ncbi:MAG: ribosome biogenesis GTPase Der [Gammaproteobacteria bacterium]|nr:ribosome biogenesis GTPase Der [Gammaproteobacteria bacterium]